jgi:hypothetical protein
MLLLCAAALLTPSCAALRDADPFLTPTVNMNIDEVTGALVVSPSIIEGDWSYGQVQVNNTTGTNHGFAIDELAIYAEIPQQTAPIIGISDAHDDTTYAFYCHIHNPHGIEGLAPEDIEYQGQLIIDYRTEEQV